MGSAIGGFVGGAFDNAFGTDLTGGKAISRGLDAQGNARDQANAASELAYKRQTEEMAPWKALGQRALASLESGDFMKNDPGMAFRMEQGQKSIDAGLAARGMANSGAALKELARYGQNFGSQEYNNAWNRQKQLADYGNQASMALGNYAGGYGANISNNALGYGNAAAGAELGKYQAQNAFGKDYMENMTQGAAAAAKFMSDERVKQNITPIPSEDLAEMRKHLKAIYFKYTSDEFGKGDWAGVLAQDLEKSKLGKTLVCENEQGLKYVDMTKVMSMFLATMAEA